MPETTPLPLLRWPCDLARPAPHRVQIFRGETVRLEALLTLNGAPVEIPAGATATLAWQSREMGGSWYVAEASLDTERGSVWADFGPDMDAGADEYRAFLRVDTDGACYRAVAALQILPSPGATINEIPIPPRVLDFATVTVLNAPYWTKAEADARFASVADATLNGRESWTFSGDTEEGVVYEVRYDFEWDGQILWGLYVDGALLSTGDANESATEEEFPYGEDKVITATRTALPGYVLGGQTDKPLPKLSDVPAVVAPSTSASDAGKAADAKATGDALAGKVSGTDDGTTIVLPSSRSVAVQGNIMATGSIEANNGSVSVGGLYVHSVQYSAETWEFTLDDDSTVQKQLLVAPVAAQGGA